MKGILVWIVNYGKNIIEKTDNYEYLGVIFNKSGNFSFAWIKNLNCKAMKSYSMYIQLRQHFNIHESSSIRLLTSLFETFVSPILTYGWDWIWGGYLPSLNRGNDTLLKTLFKDSFPFEKLHIRFSEQTLSIHSKGLNFACGAELGHLPMTIRIYRHMIYILE